MNKPSTKQPAASDAHPFLVALVNDGRPWQKKFADQAMRTGGRRQKVELSLVEFYQSEVFRYASRLAKIPDQVRVIATFMTNRPKGRALKKMGILRSEYVAYHYGNFIVLLQMAPDIAIRLTGITLALGLNPRDMKDSTIVENEWTSRFRLKDPLERLQKVSSSLKRTRNEWVHACVAPIIETTDTLSLVENAQHLSQKKLWLNDKEIDQYFDEACGDLAEQITDRATALQEAIDVLLTALHSPYRYWAARLAKDWVATAETNPKPD